MFYTLIKIPIKLALWIFCREIRVKNGEFLKETGPLLLVANHPNSFLDAIIIASRFQKPVHFLARGDAFQKPWHNFLLSAMNMIPVYRMSEGRENLHRNEYAFNKSKEVLAKNGIVLIFIEGICVNKHTLQPFKKGAARIAWENKALQGFRVLTLGIAFNSFNRFGKKVNIQLNKPLAIKELMPYEDAIPNYRYFNEQIEKVLQEAVLIPESKVAPNSNILKLLALPGLLLNTCLYTPVKNWIAVKTKGTVFFDSVLFGMLLVIYPCYLLLLGIILAYLSTPPLLIFCILLCFPLLAWLRVKINNP